MNLKKILFSILIVMSFLSVSSQEKTHEKLGNLILKSVRNNDADLFKTLIIPEAAVWENLKKLYASEWTKEQEQQAFLDLSDNYRQTIENDFMTKFSKMVSKTKLFDLDFNSVSYEVLNEHDAFDKTIGVVRIFGTIEHQKFKYFSFGMIEYQNQFYLVDPRVDISEVNKYSERDFLNSVVLSADDVGKIQSVGSLRINSQKSDAIMFQCIIDNLILFGVEEQYISKEPSKASYLKGEWQFPYRINDTENYIGTVSFNFEYTLEKGILTYMYYNYRHDTDDSDYKSLGLLPFEYNDFVAQVFTQNEYYEMLYDTEINVKLAIKRLNQIVDKCH
ncbi:hypothetical protein [Psychroserpens algicola]|uniref:DUF4468 domain-containing protein n=1 Tax=Psychroserpens algicola TaxID=1719034 RepID=A0ABT0H6R6_9FLAO|nr:hypothetical protein [Psychroserpens algicola]MCK8479877.1 hypothetical protein [Psychroserpens algicola]